MNKARFLLSKSTLLKDYSNLKSMSDLVSYSMKTNPIIGKVLEKETDSLFSLHTTESVDEINDKSRIIFFAQAWSIDEINELIKKGLKNFVVDNENDLKTLLAYLERTNQKINLFLRMRLKELTIHTGKHFVFGFYSDKLNNLIVELRSNNNIEKLGVHFHRKTQNIAEWSLKEELQESLSEKTLDLLDYVNIGGGIPVRYKNYELTNIEYIYSKINELKQWLNSKKIKMIIEPGRALAAPCIKLEATIINIYDDNIIINCSVYNSAMDTFIAHTRLEVEGELQNGDSYTIKGFTPDSLDIFRYKVFLKKPKIGDKIIFLNAGAYNFSTDFCNLRKLETVIID